MVICVSCPILSYRPHGGEPGGCMYSPEGECPIVYVPEPPPLPRPLKENWVKPPGIYYGDGPAKPKIPKPPHQIPEVVAGRPRPPKEQLPRPEEQEFVRPWKP